MIRRVAEKASSTGGVSERSSAPWGVSESGRRKRSWGPEEGLVGQF